MAGGSGPGPRGPYMNRTHCKYGHEFTEENTYWFVKGNTRTRICRTCNKERSNFRARLYGMSKERYLELSGEQDGKCAICGGPPARERWPSTTITARARSGPSYALAATSALVASVMIPSCSGRPLRTWFR